VFFEKFGASTLVHLPLAFVRSGYVDLSVGAIWHANYFGYDRSRTARSIIDAYSLGVGPGEVFPLGGGNRYAGFPLCCRFFSSLL